MSGKPITQQQVNLYMSYRKDHKQTTAAAQAGMSERTARRIDTGQHSTIKQPRAYRTRKDPLDGAFELHLIPLLKADPKVSVWQSASKQQIEIKLSYFKQLFGVTYENIPQP